MEEKYDSNTKTTLESKKKCKFYKFIDTVLLQ